MTIVKVKFRPSISVGRPGSIIYHVCRYKSVCRISSGLRLHDYEWDESLSKPYIGSDYERRPLLQSITERMERDIETIGRIIERFERRSPDYTPDEIAVEFRKVRSGDKLFSFMENRIDTLRISNRTGTANNYRAALRSFRLFRRGEDISLRSINTDLMERYQAFLYDAGLTRNSVSFHMRILRAVYNRAVRHGLTENRHPFCNVFTGMEKTRKRAVHLCDIRRIRNLELSGTPLLEYARDMFLFLFFCRGMSFIDAAFLKKTDIRHGVLTYIRSKTGQRLQIKIVPQIKSIIDRYSVSGSPYLLPVITHPGDNERKQYETALRRLNKLLKAIGEMAGISTQLTTYVGRHSWATIAKMKNVPINVISDALGHESVATTQIYLATIDSAVIDKANDLVLRGL